MHIECCWETTHNTPPFSHCSSLSFGLSVCLLLSVVSFSGYATWIHKFKPSRVKGKITRHIHPIFMYRMRTDQPDSKAYLNGQLCLDKGTDSLASENVLYVYLLRMLGHAMVRAYMHTLHTCAMSIGFPQDIPWKNKDALAKVRAACEKWMVFGVFFFYFFHLIALCIYTIHVKTRHKLF